MSGTGAEPWSSSPMPKVTPLSGAGARSAATKPKSSQAATKTPKVTAGAGMEQSAMWTLPSDGTRALTVVGAGRRSSWDATET